VNPPADLLASLELVTRGKPFPWVWLATSDQDLGARVRTVRILNYNLRQVCFTFASHADHAKHQQIAHDPRGQLCLLLEAPLIQIRLDVLLTTTPAPQHPLGERMWQKVMGNDRQALYNVHPQSPKPPQSFVIVEARSEAADVLCLGPDQRERRRHSKGPLDWTSRSVPL